MNDKYPDQDRPEGSYLDVIFAVIVLLASGFSTYTTYLGFSKDLPLYMAIAIAAIIGFGLVGTNLKIRRCRVKEGGMFGALVVFGMIFVFSFLSNTNAFYSLFIKDDIIRETQEDAWEVYERESTRALKAFDEDPVYQQELERMRNIENLLRNLNAQITDPLNPGMGPRAKVILEDIYDLLEVPSTPLQPPSKDAPMRDQAEYAERLVSHIRSLIDERRKIGVVDGRTNLWNETMKRRGKHLRRIEEHDFNKRHTDEMKRDLKWTEGQVNRWLDPKPPLSLEEINDESDEVGKFKYTWRNFADLISPVAIFLAITLGALLDIIGPAMSFGLYRPQYD